MNLLRLNLARRNALSGVFRVAFYCTEVPVSHSYSSRDTLRRRIMRAGAPTVPITDVVEKWAEEGKPVKVAELKESVRVLRKFRRSKHALQLMEWMIEEYHSKISNSDIAIYLDLIAKVRGLEEAEKYFQSIPEESRDFRIYGSLLACYAFEKSVEQAEATMKKMRELGYTRLLSYNALLKLYSQTQQYEKMDAVMQEMKDKKMGWDNYTYGTRLNAYAQASDVEGMEKLLSKMESNPDLKMDWNFYVVVANGYLKSGLLEKASAMMKKVEALTTPKESKNTSEILLTMYSQIGSKDEVHRLWHVYKEKGKLSNTTYFAMVSSLVRLDDLAGAEQIVEEWEHWKSSNDIRIPRFLITTYCKKGLFEKAEAYLNRPTKLGVEPDASMWDVLASGYVSMKETAKALEALRKAVSVSKPSWRPNKLTLASCLDYLKEKGEAEAAKELLLSIRERGSITENVYDALLDYVSGDKEALNRLGDAHHVFSESSVESDVKS